MNYIEWSQEYTDTADSLMAVIDRLKAQKESADLAGKKELDIKIAQYRSYYNECIAIANHLKARHEGVE